MKKLLILTILCCCWGQIAWAKIGEERWKEKKSMHFIIYYKEAPIDFIKNVKEEAERYYGEITENLGFTRYRGWTFDERAKIYVYNDQADYIERARQIGWSHGAASARKKEIWTFPTSHGFFDSTLPHELGHIVFREFVGFKSYIPLWLDEGVAMYQEKAKRWGANKAVKKAIEEKTFMNLRELSKMYLSNSTPREVVELYYAESASVVYYMITELGEQRFVNFCRKLERGEGFEKSLKAAYFRFRSVDDLNKAWVRYLED